MFNNYWYMIAFYSELQQNKIYTFKRLNRHLILVKTKSNDIVVLEDRCCHRNVQLSLGEYENDMFTCSYHGWQYNCDGQCVNIPSLKGPIPKTAVIDTYPVKVIHDVVWVFMGDPTLAESVDPPDLYEMENNPYIYTDHEFDCDLKFVSESLFDPYHINHVHKNSIKSFMGDLNSEQIDFQLEATEDRIFGEYDRVNNGTFYEKKYFGSAKYIPTEFEFIFPNISKIKIKFENRTLIIYEHMVEVEDGRVAMIQLTVWENIFKPFPAFAKWFMKRISNEIVNEDIEFFKSHYQLKQNQQYKDVHIKSDEVSIAFRKLWDKKVKLHD